MMYGDALFLGIFLPLTIILYNVIPQKHRWKVLLVSSYIFFWSISGKLIIYLLLTTLSMHYFGLWLSSVQEERDKTLKEAEKEEKKKIKLDYLKKQRKILLFAAFLQIGTLVVLKYSAFLGKNINELFGLFNLGFKLKVPKFFMPIGISFYTFQAMSYIIDVYRGTIKADKNLGRLSLFISFFPQIMEGPICRYSETANNLWECKKTSFKSLTFGLQRMGFGLVKQLVVANRLNIFVMNVFNCYSSYSGGIIAVAMVLYTVQLYMDFSGTMDIVIGVAEIFGVKLPENFRQPFFSKSISEFWTRWHITLGAWFRDYIFYPLSLSDKLKRLTKFGREKLGNYYGPLLASTIALFCVWLSNGIWHGAAWSFIFFGMYHFSLILLGKLVEPLVKKVNTKLHINSENFVYKFFQIVRTTILVFIGELFFRANSLKAGFEMFGKMITGFSLALNKDGNLFSIGLDKQDFFIVLFILLIVLIVGILREKGISIREELSKKHIALRWLVYYSLILAIVVFGAYGAGYIPVDPMYAEF